MKPPPEPTPHDAVATLRHDLRTPLNQIIGYSELIQEEAAESGLTSIYKDLDRILGASRHLLAMINVVVEPGQIQLLKELPNLTRLGIDHDYIPALPTTTDLDHVLPRTIEDEIHLPPLAHDEAATILVVDDDPQNCDVLSRRLIQEGYKVVQAYGGREALARLREVQEIDVVLLDVLMPEVGGFEVLVNIKSDEAMRHIPVIMISALDQLESVVRCIQHGADDYLGKPYNLTLLRARLGASLDRKRLRDQEQRIYLALKKTQEALVIEQEKSEMLLLNMLPKPIAAILREGSQTIAENHRDATILFADLANFTELSRSISPMALVELLNEVFLAFDSLAEKYGVEKIKTIGDCYMVAAGVPLPREDHATAIVHMALDMQACVRETQFRGRKLGFRIGVNSGPVVAGVIGRKKFIYDLWGDAVNTASRMESNGTIGQVQISRSTHDLIQEDFVCEPKGLMHFKGKGELEVWHVLSRREG